MKTLIPLVLLSLLSSCLPDNDDHSHCAPKEKKGEQKLAGMQIRKGIAFQLPYTIRQGHLFVEEDISLGKKEDHSSEAIAVLGKKWTDGIVYYRFGEKFTKKKKMPRRALKAMKIWEEALPGIINFIEADQNTPNFVEITLNDTGVCWSYVGMNGGRQEISLDTSCGKGTIVHELGHTLGLWHEQSRSDRDDFIEVKWCNIKKDKIHNFRRITRGSIDIGPYNFKSVMHYPRGAFSKNMKITLKSKTKTKIPFIPKRKLTVGDINAIRCIYDDTVECQ